MREGAIDYGRIHRNVKTSSPDGTCVLLSVRELSWEQYLEKGGVATNTSCSVKELKKHYWWRKIKEREKEMKNKKTEKTKQQIS